MLSHGISIGALFLLVGVIYERRHTKLIEEFGGLARVMPAYAAIFVIITLSSIALPGMNGFVGEFLILWGTFTSKVLLYPRWLTAAAVTGVILGAVYMLSAVMRVFFGSLKNPKNKSLPDLNAREWVCLLPLVAVAIFMGLFPNPFLKRIEPAVELLRMDYLKKAAMSATVTKAYLGKPVDFLLPDGVAGGTEFTRPASPMPSAPLAPAGPKMPLQPVAPTATTTILPRPMPLLPGQVPSLATPPPAAPPSTGPATATPDPGGGGGQS